MRKKKLRHFKEEYNLQTGYFTDGLPYARIGRENDILLNIEALSMKHKPPSGFNLTSFIKLSLPYLNKYTIYLVNRKPNLPENYLMDKMAEDYAKLIRREFKRKVDVIGISTGGQIALQLAVDHPDVIRKLIVISAAYRISEKGAKIERKAAEYFKEEKYGKTMATLAEFIFPSGFKKRIAKFFIRLIGKRMIGEVEYPNDFWVEVTADREMNLLDRLHEIEAPSLILSGESDIGYTADDVKKTAEKISKSELILYEGYGHNLFIINRKQLQKDISKFIKI
ncbi:MAG: hypothetical protein BAJALOKI2v1_210051 [Promethearchaeota archaeon]|nr:MAG: hypothetical protein BAJALOKI2v1_210051 [Candidatus Lokiarchaeota archaeon]